MKLQSRQHRARSTSANCRNKERLLHLTQAYVANSSTNTFGFCGGLPFRIRGPIEWKYRWRKLLLASQLPEARKFSRDDRLRSSTPGPEAVRLKTPALSHSLALISFVVVHRSADGDRDHRTIGIKRRYDERDRRSKAQGCHPAQGAGVDACNQVAQCLTSAQLTFRRYPVNGAWPAEMRIDMLAAYLDFRSVRELMLAVSRGEAPPPTRYRGAGRAREAIWVKVIVDEHVAPGIKVRQNLAKVDLAALA